MVAKPSSAKNEIKVIGLVDQGAHSLRSSDLFDWDLRTTGFFIFKQVEPLEPPPLVIASTFRTNEIFLFVERLAHHFRWRQCKLDDRIAVQLQAAEIWPSSWYRILIEADGQYVVGDQFITQ